MSLAEEGFNSCPTRPLIEQIYAKEMTIGKLYPLDRLERTTTKFGDALLAFIEVEGEIKKIFLPKTYALNLTEEQIDAINTTDEFDLICAEKVLSTYRFEKKARKGEKEGAKE